MICMLVLEITKGMLGMSVETDSWEYINTCLYVIITDLNEEIFQ